MGQDCDPKCLGDIFKHVSGSEKELVIIREYESETRRIFHCRGREVCSSFRRAFKGASSLKSYKVFKKQPLLARIVALSVSETFIRGCEVVR